MYMYTNDSYPRKTRCPSILVVIARRVLSCWWRSHLFSRSTRRQRWKVCHGKKLGKPVGKWENLGRTHAKMEKN